MFYRKVCKQTRIAWESCVDR